VLFSVVEASQCKEDSMATASFNPNRLTFEEGLKRIEEAATRAGVDRERTLTSRDDEVIRALDALEIENVPDGFKKWQLPLALRCESQLFVTVGQPGVKVPPHSHDEGHGVRFIAGGSISYEGRELTAGDWMYIPAGQEYSFEVGRYGAIMCYCYCCCCA
jgi:hypothetical protein